MVYPTSARKTPSCASSSFSIEILLSMALKLGPVHFVGQARVKFHVIRSVPVRSRRMMEPLFRAAAGCVGSALIVAAVYGNYQMTAKIRIWQPGLARMRIVARQAPWCLTPEMLLGSTSNDRKALERGLAIMRRWRVGMFRPRPDVASPPLDESTFAKQTCNQATP